VSRFVITYFWFRQAIVNLDLVRVNYIVYVELKTPVRVHLFCIYIYNIRNVSSTIIHDYNITPVRTIIRNNKDWMKTLV